MRETFDRLVAVARDQGPITVYAQKTRIVFQERVRFASIVVRRDSLDVGLWLKSDAAHPLIARTEYFGKIGNVYHFRLTQPSDIDRGLIALMNQAYAVGQQQSVAGSTSNWWSKKAAKKTKS